MIVDTSAVNAILLDEPERRSFAATLVADQLSRMSAVSYVEASLLLAGRTDPQALHAFDALLAELGIVIEPFTAEQARAARQAGELWQGPSPRQAQLRRLLQLRAGQGQRRGVAVQGRRFLADRHRRGIGGLSCDGAAGRAPWFGVFIGGDATRSRRSL